VTGDYSAFWDERNYVKDAAKVRAAVLAVHGLSDWNVKVKHVAQWYEALRKHGVEHKIWLHQAAHTDPDTLRSVEWRRTVNRWFSHYLHGIDNGIEREPKATIQREDKTTWVDEADWPAPGTSTARVHPWAGGSAKGSLRFQSVPGSAVVESLRDDSSKLAEDLVDLPASGNRLSYATKPATSPVRFSGVARVDLAVSFDRPAANVTALLVDRAPDGTSHVITRGWTDPQNRVSPSRTKPIEPGKQYMVEVELEPTDYVVPTGHSVEFVVISSDHDYTLRPMPGTGVSIDLTSTVVALPVVGGSDALRRSVG
jgi:X-Pro dipeptidyl-peptidase